MDKMRILFLGLFVLIGLSCKNSFSDANLQDHYKLNLHLDIEFGKESSVNLEGDVDFGRLPTGMSQSIDGGHLIGV